MLIDTAKLVAGWRKPDDNPQKEQPRRQEEEHVTPLEASKRSENPPSLSLFLSSPSLSVSCLSSRVVLLKICFI